MSRITVDVDGFNVTYDENANEWSFATGFGNETIKASSLKGLRAKLADIERAARRLDAVPLLFISKWSGELGQPVKGTLLDDNGSAVWVLRQRGKREERVKLRLREIALDTPEVRAAIDRYNNLMKQASDLNKQAEDLFDALPRATADDLKAISQKDAA